MDNTTSMESRQANESLSPRTRRRMANTSNLTISTTNVKVSVKVRTKLQLSEAYTVGLPLGIFGGHHFYLGNKRWAFTYLFTFGLLGCGWIADLIRMPVLVKRANKQRDSDGLAPDLKHLDQAYVFWFPFGILGFHHFYLNRPLWGILYLLTYGLLGLGWLSDSCKMKVLVDNANEAIITKAAENPNNYKKASDIYTFVFFPITGLLGVHHFLLNRSSMGLFYLLTLGNFGIGWLVDMFRLPILVDRYNTIQSGEHPGKKHLDDAYIYLFPAGIVGMHHFYLGRKSWGLFYMFTFGGFGVGWISDFFRLPRMVREYNKAVDEGLLLIQNFEASERRHSREVAERINREYTITPIPASTAEPVVNTPESEAQDARSAPCNDPESPQNSNHPWYWMGPTRFSNDESERASRGEGSIPSRDGTTSPPPPNTQRFEPLVFPPWPHRSPTDPSPADSAYDSPVSGMSSEFGSGAFINTREMDGGDVYYGGLHHPYRQYQQPQPVFYPPQRPPEYEPVDPRIQSLSPSTLPGAHPTHHMPPENMVKPVSLEKPPPYLEVLLSEDDIRERELASGTSEINANTCNPNTSSGTQEQLFSTASRDNTCRSLTDDEQLLLDLNEKKFIPL